MYEPPSSLQYQQGPACQATANPLYVYQFGCFRKLEDVVHESGIIIMGVGIGIAFVEVSKGANAATLFLNAHSAGILLVEPALPSQHVPLAGRGHRAGLLPSLRHQEARRRLQVKAA